MYELSGGCHCGRIRFHYRSPVAPDVMQARSCSCGFCRRIGGNYTSHPQGALAAKIPGRPQPYRFGTETAEFWVCSRCGNTPFVTSEINGHRYAVINVNNLDDLPIDSGRISPADFEGEALDSRLARRSANWIANVDLQFLPEPEAEGA